MRRWLAPIVCAVGVVFALIGFWWLWTGLDIVQVERGWSAVIGGSTITSAGLIMVAIAAVLVRLGDIAEALAPAGPAPAPLHAGRDAPDERQASSPKLTGAPAHEPKDDPQIVGRHVSGDSTYVMFSDGTVEAHTPDGVLHFRSLDELRAYADEREASSERT